MTDKPTYEELEKRIRELEKDLLEWKSEVERLRGKIDLIEGHSRFIDEPDHVFSDHLHKIIDQLVDALRSESKRLNEKIVALQSENFDLTRHIDELRNSISR